jgi:hypothetical protein
MVAVLASLRESLAWSPQHLSRREALQQAAAFSAAAVLLPVSSLPANAAITEETPRVTTRMGGNLETFQDGPRGLRMMVPSGWNKVCRPTSIRVW